MWHLLGKSYHKVDILIVVVIMGIVGLVAFVMTKSEKRGYEQGRLEIQKEAVKLGFGRFENNDENR